MPPAPSTISVPPVPHLPFWKRVLAFVGYIAVYYFVSKTIVTLLVVGTTIALYFYGLDVTFPTWIFTTEKIGAAIIGIGAAWIVGRYFHWTVFRKIPREKKPHGWFIKTTFYGASALIVVLFILVTAPSVLGLIFKDIAPINDSDLSLPKVSLTDEQNAYPDLMAAGKALDTTYDTQQLRDIVAGANWDAQFAAQAIASNTPALTSLASAAQKPSFQDPTAADPSTVSVSTILTSLSPWRTLIRFNSLAALYLAHTGKSTQAIQTAMQGVDVAQKVESSQNFLIGWLVAVSMKTQSLQTLQNIIASTTVNTKDLKALAANLKPYTNDASGLVKADKINYYEQKSTIEYLVHGDTSDAGASGQALAISSQIDRTNFYFHPNQSISFLAGDVRQRIASAQAPCNALTESEPTKTLPSNLWLLYVTPNAIGKVIHDITAVSLDSTKIKACQENVLLGATQLMAGIKAYQQDNKKLPATLNELMPTYLADMPLDPFSGQAFQYDPNKKTISSVGQDSPTFSVAF
jgi:hypothetical protein